MRTLFIGGTGTISTSCVAEAVRVGHEVSVLNRGRSTRRELPMGADAITADYHDTIDLDSLINSHPFDVVVNFLSFDAADASRMSQLLQGRITQYIHISTASAYHKPLPPGPIVESTPLHNPHLLYSRNKIAAERVLQDAYERSGFPTTIVRPSHTYDDAEPPLTGAWTAWDRIARGDEIVVSGDGTSLWTITHAQDLAVGLVGLIGNPRAIGEDFHITSDDVLSWDEIYRVAARAAGVAPRIRHLSAQLIKAAAPDWGWADLYLGDLSHSAVFDNRKIRGLVPEYAPAISWAQAAPRLAAFRAAHPDETRPDPELDRMLGRLVDASHAAEQAVRALP